MRALALLALLCSPALADTRPPSACLALAMGEARVIAASTAALNPDELRITYLGHASFALETTNLMAVTDYTGTPGPAGRVPDVVTMNNAHSSHFTDTPDPNVPWVLRGWGPPGQPAQINLDLEEMAIRNVTTDLRGPFGEGARRDGNSIFLFEAAGLCVAHLSHLHQIPNAAQYGAIGRVDVVMVPVDGAFTMKAVDMAQVARHLHARLVLPMHWFSAQGLQDFVAALRPSHKVRTLDHSDVVVTAATLPSSPEIWILPPQNQN